MPALLRSQDFPAVFASLSDGAYWFPVQEVKEATAYEEQSLHMLRSRVSNIGDPVADHNHEAF